MLINGINLNSLNVKLYDRVLTSNEVLTQEEWIDGDLQPTFVRQQDKFKNVQLKFLILESDETAAFAAMSKVTALLKKATIVFDDLDYSFDVSLTGKTSQERLKNGKFILTVNLQSGYAEGDELTYTTDTALANNFDLTIMYYRDGNVLIGSEKVNIREADFEPTGNTFASIGIDLNKYKREHYQNGIPTNFTGIELTYNNLKSIQALLVNYAPVVYTVEAHHFMLVGDLYQLTHMVNTNFTYPQVQSATTIGEIIDIASYKPIGYQATINFEGELTVENILEQNPITIYYKQMENEREKTIKVIYKKEESDETYPTFETKTRIVKESDIVSGMRLSDIVLVNSFKPAKYYESGEIQGHLSTELITFDSLKDEYVVHYARTENTTYVEYYRGEYPDWHRVATAEIKSKYDSKYAAPNYPFDVVTDLGVSLDRYANDKYEAGVLINRELITSYDEAMNAGVLQVYYVPKEFEIEVRYYIYSSVDGEHLGTDKVTIKDTQFISGPSIGDIIPLNKYKPEGYILDTYYEGPVTLEALINASPLVVTYAEVFSEATKEITIRYRKELAAAYSTIGNFTIEVKQSDVAAGVRLKDIIPLDKYLPEYYNSGIVDGHSLEAVYTFEELKSNYTVLYTAKTYSTNVRYYTDVIDDYNWIGSDVINYRVIDFTVDTTLISLGLNINAFKPAYCGDGVVQYTGPVTFIALQSLSSIDVIYESIEEPTDPDDPGITYPKRFLFLETNDLKGYEGQYPSWQFNHAYINTGFTAPDMSKVTIICETEKITPSTNLNDVIVGDGYLFGSTSGNPTSTFGMKYTNFTTFLPAGQNPMPNNFTAQAGTKPTVLAEETAIGFSRNTGIYANERPGYSFATFTYTSTIFSDNTSIQYPIFLFANNNKGTYADGIAGVGIYRCKIYYDNELMRDFIPVEYFDKIGDKVAPSNCLYDKVSQTFFEDARGLNSFNVKNDPNWIPDLEHRIGSCYVNYYKDTGLFETRRVSFRGDEFKEPWNAREKFLVDETQPAHHGPGVIEGIEELGDLTFDKLNNKVFNVTYESLGFNVVVNYWKDSMDGGNLLQMERVSLTPSDFYNNPTFGDLIRINKHKPAGYITDFEYVGKVTLNRIVEGSPYDIVYKPAAEVIPYKTTVDYFKEIKEGYKPLGSKEVTIDNTNFKDGEYVEFHIDFSSFKPPYTNDGEPKGWYLRDERLDHPDDLQDKYEVKYTAAETPIELRYYTDVVEEDNLVASKTWTIKESRWAEGEEFFLEKEIPYDLVDQFKPQICLSGVIQDSKTNFINLAEKGYVDIVYTTIQEPTDPEGKVFPRKVLYFESFNPFLNSADGEEGDARYESLFSMSGGYSESIGWKRPWIDTGYKPKDLGRMTLQAKSYALSEGCASGVLPEAFQNLGATHYIGYYGMPLDVSYKKYYYQYLSRHSGGKFPPIFTTAWDNNSIGSTGCCSIGAHKPIAGGYVYTCDGPQEMDGYQFMKPASDIFVGEGRNEYVTSVFGSWRKGLINQNLVDKPRFEDATTGEQIIPTNVITDRYDSGSKVHKSRIMVGSDNTASPRYVGMDVTLSPYRNYSEISNLMNTTNPVRLDVTEEVLNGQEDDRDNPCKPVDSLTLFASRNPDTGKINIPTFPYYTNAWGGMTVPGKPNPGGDSIKVSVDLVVGKDEMGNDITQTITVERNNQFEKFKILSNPGISKAYIWGVKILDRDRLVRDMIPVEKGQEIYDYIAPSNCLFDIVTETFFGNSNQGGTYKTADGEQTIVVKPEDVLPLKVKSDPTTWGRITVNYYKDKNVFLGNKSVDVPINFNPDETTKEEVFFADEMWPGKYYLKGYSDFGGNVVDENTGAVRERTLKEIFELGFINVFYDQVEFEKEVVYYEENHKIGTGSFKFTLKALEQAKTLKDLGILTDLYDTADYKPGRYVFEDNIFEEDDFDKVLEIPSIPVIKEKLDSGYFYTEYRRASASTEAFSATDNKNYYSCDLQYMAMTYPVVKAWDKHSFEYGAEVSEIQYKTIVNVTMITADKTWGYVEGHGWVHLKEVTTAQEGRYLAALDCDSYDLSAIDWSKSYNNFNDLGIDLQKWKLEYHDEYVNEYAGEYTQTALDELNNIIITYPEHLYEYNALYYKDNLLTESIIASEPFPFTINDFWIDWDVFIATDPKNQTDEYIIMTQTTVSKVKPGVEHLNSIKIYKEGIFKVENRTEGWVQIYEPKEEIYCWVETKYLLDYVPSPTLTGVRINWTDLGLDVNKHKPAFDYENGIPTWNPLTYKDETDIDIKLDELIIAGGQKILYPYMYPKYKAMFTHSYVELKVGPFEKEDAYDARYADLCFRQEFVSTSRDWKMSGKTTKTGFSYWNEDLPGRRNTTPSDSGSYGGANQLEFLPDFTIASDEALHVRFDKPVPDYDLDVLQHFSVGTRDTSDPGKTATYYPLKQCQFAKESNFDFVVNFSGEKGRGNIIARHYDKSTKRWADKYSIAHFDRNRTVELKDEFFNKDPEYFIGYSPLQRMRRVVEDDNVTGKVYLGAGIADSNSPQTNGKLTKVDDGNKTVWNYYKVYYRNKLVNYYIALPKGYPLPTGKVMPQNGLYDILNDFISIPVLSTNKGETIFTDDYINLGNNDWWAPPILFHEKSDVEKDAPLDYFGEQEYEEVEVNFTAITTGAAKIYQYPNIYSNEVVVLPPGQTFPVFKQLKDTTWYFIGSGWIQAADTSLETAVTYQPSIVNEVAIKGDRPPVGAGWALKLEPNADSPASSNLLAVYDTVEKVYAKSGNYYWIGKGWLNYLGTDQNVITQEPPKRVLTIIETPVFKFPISQQQGQEPIKNYSLGTELYINKILTRDDNWGKTGEGWIEMKNVTDWVEKGE